MAAVMTVGQRDCHGPGLVTPHLNAKKKMPGKVACNLNTCQAIRWIHAAPTAIVAAFTTPTRATCLVHTAQQAPHNGPADGLPVDRHQHTSLL